MSLILPSGTLRNELVNYFDLISPPRDKNMVCPTLAWLRRFARWCRANPWQYISETADCDKAAIHAVYAAGECTRKNKALWGNGYAVLYCVVRIANAKTLNGIGAGEHATNLVRTAEDGWYFLDRQTARIEDFLDAVERGAIDQFRFVLV